MKLGLKTIDRYIIRKFIGTYFFAILLIICIVIIFDISEKIDDFVSKKAPLDKIIFDYYLNFIPFFLNAFSSLFVFIAVIFFTSKMAYNTEIIAILSNGTGFLRMLFPYFISASIIFTFSLTLNHFIIPQANKVRLAFEDQYINKPYRKQSLNLHLQVEPGIYLYISNFFHYNNRAENFSLERFEKNRLQSKLVSEHATWDTTSGKWNLHNCFIRDIQDSAEIISAHQQLDTMVNFSAEELRQRDSKIMAMNYFELSQFIKEQKMRGVKSTAAVLEQYNRTSIPFSVFILTLIGVSLSSRKVRGGIGLQIGAGIALSFTYILLLRFSEVFIQVGLATPPTAAWLPNLLFLIIAIMLYRTAPK
ncbi:MAG: LptF/LptG family permease [Prevotellaceae bacterium]|nr:LptF/LptG family permease [Prevotellaceae bacterium]